jgi:hypothetical protein
LQKEKSTSVETEPEDKMRYITQTKSAAIGWATSGL